MPKNVNQKYYTVSKQGNDTCQKRGKNLMFKLPQALTSLCFQFSFATTLVSSKSNVLKAKRYFLYKLNIKPGNVDCIKCKYMIIFLKITPPA